MMFFGKYVAIYTAQQVVYKNVRRYNCQNEVFKLQNTSIPVYRQVQYTSQIESPQFTDGLLNLSY